MTINIIKKRCERCTEIYELPAIKKSKAKDLLLQYFPCSHCGFRVNGGDINKNKSGRCKDCYIPFAVVDHHAEGCCHRCYVRRWRKRRSQI